MCRGEQHERRECFEGDRPGGEDGESGLISAYRAGCHVIDVTQMDAYPMCDGLRRAKVKALAERSWL